MRRIFLLFCLTVFVAAFISAANAQDTKRLTLDMYLDWDYVASPQISPDGSQIVYTKRWTDKINDRFESEVWVMNADGSKNRFLMKGGAPQWSPDGKRIAYVAPGQPAGAQIFVRWMDTNQDSQITRVDRSPSGLQWSPDGKRIAFNMLVPARPEMRVNMPPRPEGARWVEPPRVIGRLNYRADTQGWTPEGFMHIFIVPDTGGTARKLTDGDYNHGGVSWMPDSNTIVFSGTRKPDAEYVRFGSEVYSLNISTGQIKALTERNGPDGNPEVSPNGKLIAYTGFDLSSNTYTVSKLYLMNSDGSNKRVLTANLDRAPNEITWDSNSNTIYFTAEDRGTNNLWSVSASSGEPQQFTKGNHQLSVSSFSSTGLFAGTLSGPQESGDVVTFTIRQPTPRRLTNVNEDLLEGRKLGDVEEVWYDSVGGMKVQGWIVKPPDFSPSKKYPLILYIHGGPHAMYGVGFNFEFQQHAAEGYLVLYTNPRGSTGYGQEFGNAINNNYPGQDYDDLINGVDTVIKKGYVDERNLFVCGGSGGGVLTSWIVGHTDRFTAAVVMKPVVNWYSFVGTTDGADWYYNFKKLPWEDPSEHIRRSPLTYVGNVKTPTMLMTGELDLRTPMEQTEQYYRALKLRKVDTLMVRIQDEYHPFNSTPRHPSNRLSQILYLRGWFEKYKKR